MGTHHLKILPEYFLQVAIGNKTFELRKNDRDFKVGDIIFLEEWDNEYTGRVLELEITYILSNFKGLEEGYVILSVSFVNPTRSTNCHNDEMSRHVGQNSDGQKMLV